MNFDKHRIHNKKFMNFKTASCVMMSTGTTIKISWMITPGQEQENVKWGNSWRICNEYLNFWETSRFDTLSVKTIVVF